MRTLKPYIWRDFETRPLKLQLLDQIVAVPHLYVTHIDRVVCKQVLKCTVRVVIASLSYFHCREDADFVPCRYPIDYCYLHSRHVPQINALLTQFFWPGIDGMITCDSQYTHTYMKGAHTKNSSLVKEYLSYPDYTVVALYKRKVIGCALMTPGKSTHNYNSGIVVFVLTSCMCDLATDAYLTYILVHPEWEGCGIASFMLYHIIQVWHVQTSCVDVRSRLVREQLLWGCCLLITLFMLWQTITDKDITLHVSVTNPALIMYQKFGFKPEAFIIDFYKKYYPDDSKECLNAFFLRLRR
jgi:ribosomal protein S18 acetylase RimI-like enzyme